MKSIEDSAVKALINQLMTLPPFLFTISRVHYIYKTKQPPMRKLISTRYSEAAFNSAMLFLRLIVGVLMMHHGYDKLIHYGDMHNQFMNFWHGQYGFILPRYFCRIFLRIVHLSACLAPGLQRSC